ncbi:hydroxyacylglutathione hydrolase [Thiocapsa imhoffii]|uniref:Hydroxyacylglutathione hydrolase n=1 Tax=Thiocapsa imhoffii TaxID=382777 RepID=A0A9X0WHH4_9GAMM|nr:hydroxyacylglutathione hydrolase [Thiocapsa imhoffii]MBK1644678.1 hydroxyacylglutathione hydrolase [Thiocapsa imhoffii]
MLTIRPIPAFSDNYIWILTDSDAPRGARAQSSSLAVVVDPGDAEPVIAHLQAESRTLGAILITHHHGDHIGGVAELRAAFPAAQVFGPVDPRIRGITHPVRDGERFRPHGIGMAMRVMAVPGHTSTHIAYLGDGVLFCGDTLFAGGCGRVFDGTFEQLSDSLDRIAALPADTLIYCAHEYTLANLGFARWVEPQHEPLRARLEADGARDDAGEPTVPSRLELERATNPFLRTRVPAVIAAAEQFAERPLTTPREVFKALRQWKDTLYD